MSLRLFTCRDCGFESPRGNRCLSLVRVVSCQVEFSASGRSLVQRSPTELWCVWVWSRNLLQEALAHWGCRAMRKENWHSCGIQKCIYTVRAKCTVVWVKPAVSVLTTGLQTLELRADTDVNSHRINLLYKLFLSVCNVRISRALSTRILRVINSPIQALTFSAKSFAFMFISYDTYVKLSDWAGIHSVADLQQNCNSQSHSSNSRNTCPQHAPFTKRKRRRT